MSQSQNRPNRILCRTLLGACVSLLGITSSVFAQADKESRVEYDESILNESPYDVMTMKKDSGGEVVRLLPIDFPGGKPPTNPEERDLVRVSLVIHPDRKYDVRWGDIESVVQYQDLVLAETKRLMGEKKYATAFEHLDYLRTNYPDTTALNDTRRDFIYESGVDLVKQGSLTHGLAVFESLQEQFPGYQSTRIKGYISEIANRLVKKYYDEGKLTAAQKLLERLTNDYQSPPLKVVQDWNARLLAEAEDLQRKSVAARAENDYRAARDYASRMLAIFPKIEGGKQLLDDLIREYPMIRVAVFQRTSDYDPTSLIDWAARRSGLLVSEPLFEYLATGPEGGKYEFAFGDFEQSDDRRSLELKFDEVSPTAFSSYDVSQWMLRRADPNAQDYAASWAAIFSRVEVLSAGRMFVQLRQPHVLPHAMLQWQIRNMVGESQRDSVGAYTINQSDLGETFFKLDPDRAAQTRESASADSGQPVEIVERYYDDPADAVSDLARGEIEVIDQLYPADVKRLDQYDGINVSGYSLPSVHMLVPLSDHPYLAEADFRRALLYATNREAILNQELLGGNLNQGSELISGPFPKGVDETDPLSYAYDSTIPPFKFDPRLALLLTKLVDKNMSDKAIKAGEEMPEFETLRLGVPDFEAAKIAGEACIQQWQIIDVPAELVVLTEGMTDEALADIDILYVSAAMWEPATDAERFFGEDGIAASTDPFIVQALGKLRQSRNWTEVRTSLQDIHRLVSLHLPVLPLWQVTDAFAFSNNVKGIAKQPMSLYQDLNKWRIQPR
jgi:tetratricopeptide (TPR) repeat protein